MKVLDRAQRPALAAKLLLDARDGGLRQPSHRRFAHGHAVLEGSQLLGERVQEARNDQNAVDLFRGKQVRDRENVSHVRRVEAPSE